MDYGVIIGGGIKRVRQGLKSQGQGGADLGNGHHELRMASLPRSLVPRPHTTTAPRDISDWESGTVGLPRDSGEVACDTPNCKCSVVALVPKYIGAQQGFLFGVQRLHSGSQSSHRGSHRTIHTCG